MLTRPRTAASAVGAKPVGNEVETLHDQVFFGGKRLNVAKSCGWVGQEEKAMCPLP